MSVSKEYEEYIVERLECFGPVYAKRMFGGLGIYLNDLFFALVANNTLYFKVDDSNLSDYKKAGMSPFRPYDDKPYSMNYFEVPGEIIEDDQSLSKWADKAFQVALAAKASKSGTKKKRSG